MRHLINKEKIKLIAIACCTYKRGIFLAKLLNSLDELNLPDVGCEILIIDNDANQSAKEIVKEFKNKTHYKMHYFVEKNAGLSNARNRALKEANSLNASHLAFVDDDEIVDKNWLWEHVNFYKNINIFQIYKIIR